MRGIYEDRRRRALARLEEIAMTKGNLVFQVAELDTEEEVLQAEVKSLHNWQAPIAVLNDDICKMIFEAGALQHEQMFLPHFGSLVSHVTRRWRKIALTTPRLWSKISIDMTINLEESGDPHLIDERQRASTFLSRCASVPVEFYMRGLGLQDCYFQLVYDHFEHCRHLSITDATSLYIREALEHLSRQKAPLLNSIRLSLNGHETRGIALDEPLFPLGAPCLTTAQIDMHGVNSMSTCFYGLQHLKYLLLSNLVLDQDRYLDEDEDEDEEDDEDCVASFRNALMSLRSLEQLELKLYYFNLSITPSLCIPLPTLQFLSIDGHHAAIIVSLMNAIQAPSVTTLSLKGRGTIGALEQKMESYFPSVQHLILLDMESYEPDLLVIAAGFPGIERLTCQIARNFNSGVLDLLDMLDTIIAVPKCDGTKNTIRYGLQQWPKLHTVAVGTAEKTLPYELLYDTTQLAALHREIFISQQAGHPIQKLKLPETVLDQMDAVGAAALREIVKVENFSLDWPTPFKDIYIS